MDEEREELQGDSIVSIIHIYNPQNILGGEEEKSQTIGDVSLYENCFVSSPSNWRHGLMTYEVGGG